MRIMQMIYPNLDAATHGKMMRMAFWIFTGTCAVLLATIAGIQLGIISMSIAKVVEQGIGPVLALNIALLFYLGDQDFRATLPQD